MMYVLLSALMYVLGFLFFYPLLFVAFIPLFLVQLQRVEASRYGAVFLYGFVFVLLYHLALTYPLISESPLSYLLYVLLSSAFYALALFIPWRIRPVLGMQRAMIGVPFFWLLVEWAQLHLSFGYPVPGNALPSGITQWYAYMSVQGGTFWILLVNLVGFYVGRSYLKHRQVKPLVGQSILLALLLVLLPAFTLPKVDATDDEEVVSISVEYGRAMMVADSLANKAITNFFEPIHSPFAYRDRVWRGAKVMVPDDAHLPDRMRLRMVSVRAREIHRPVVWQQDGLLHGVDREGRAITPTESTEFVASGLKTYFARTGSFPARISVFVAMFLLLYTISFSLRGATLHRKQ